MTREEYHAHQRQRAVREGMAPEQFDAVFQTYPCWCGQAFCPGWQTLTEREVDVLLAIGPSLGHSAGFLGAFHPVPQE